jgi:ATP-dependent DNA ligase
MGKSKRLKQAQFVIVGWSDPEGSRPLIGAVLLAYYEPDGRSIYAGSVGAGMSVQDAYDASNRLQPLSSSTMTLSAPPPPPRARGLESPAGATKSALGCDPSLLLRSPISVGPTRVFSGKRFS